MDPRLVPWSKRGGVVSGEKTENKGYIFIHLSIVSEL